MLTRKFRGFADRKLFLFFWVLLFIAFCSKAFIFLDPDFGWRIKAGEIYLNSGIPETDPFSYTMSAFPWVDHAWSQSLLFYFIYSKLGYFGLALLESLLAILGLYLISFSFGKPILSKEILKNLGFYINTRFLKPFFFELSYEKLGLFLSFPVLLGASIFFTFFGIRAQTVSWLMMSFLVLILFKSNLGKAKYIIPPLFLFWANLHGSFLMGLTTFFIFLFLKSVRTKKALISEWTILIVSILLTFINPYEGGIWKEAFSSISDTKLRFSIVEWMPALMMLDLAIVSFIGISFSLFVKYRKKLRLEETGLYIFFLTSALLSRRHLPLFVIIAIPVTVKTINFLLEDAKKVKKGQERFTKFYKTLWLTSLIIFFIQAIFAFREAGYLGYGGFYPKEAVSYLNENLPRGEIFSEYGWGGYLIWKLPQKKVFVDGRMPSWRWDEPDNAGLTSAFDTYNEVLSGKVDYRKVFERYDVEVVLWSKPKEEDKLDDLTEKLEGFLSVFGWETSDFDLLQALEQDGWVKVYEDEVAVLYKSPR
ncbi:MAG: putative membrane protein [Candidatus Woesebacteria bacterium GW2011_GWB1_39_12]|uniref:Putative membrane protein n=2 Tax=Candidatus Woeseibacteriota TaxID=1752722 RepID=A0A0G0M1D7_9BACT|nr:MAG: putative membrane protein [Candidatus Woesebacteria bacterium GW2011_GWA1_39_12]KKR01317.1 MAG: putative membrane protein [Candidatus Woesebacteria bacterium GW2011_GWB1_39_12]